MIKAQGWGLMGRIGDLEAAQRDGSLLSHVGTIQCPVCALERDRYPIPVLAAPHDRQLP